jgi:hypothetical protein
VESGESFCKELNLRSGIRGVWISLNVVFFVWIFSRKRTAIRSYSPTSILPFVRSKVLSRRNNHVRACLPITSLLINLCSPPFESLHPTWVHEAKEYDNESECQARV